MTGKPALASGSGPSRNGSRSRGRHLWITLGIAVALLAVWGSRANFFPSDRWLGISVYPVILAGLAVTLLTVLAARGTRFGFPEIRSTWIRAGLAVVIVPAFAIFMSWLVLSIAVPDIITRLSESHIAEIHELRKEHVDSHRGCDHRVFGPPFERGYSIGYYCAGPAEFARLPARGAMRIHGRQSWFGKHVEWVEPVDPPK
jgi:hypothetical protein